MILPREIAVWPLRLYRRSLSPLLAPRCRYHPSCSAYAIEAVRSFGILRGGALACWRLLRCNPLSLGGYDPVGPREAARPASPPLADPSRQTTGLP